MVAMAGWTLRKAVVVGWAGRTWMMGRGRKSDVEMRVMTSVNCPPNQPRPIPRLLGQQNAALCALPRWASPPKLERVQACPRAGRGSQTPGRAGTDGGGLRQVRGRFSSCYGGGVLALFRPRGTNLYKLQACGCRPGRQNALWSVLAASVWLLRRGFIEDSIEASVFDLLVLQHGPSIRHGGAAGLI